MPTFIVPKDAAAGGGIAVPAGFEIVDDRSYGKARVAMLRPRAGFAP